MPLAPNPARAAASAGGAVARALAWQTGDEAAVISDLETTLQHVANAQRRLHESITELRIATYVDEPQDEPERT